MRAVSFRLALASLSLPTLWAQTNLPPVASGTIPTLTARPTTGPTRVLGLGNYFRDPEPAIVMRTTLGDIPITLFSDAAVATTVNNFLAYVDAQRFNNSIVHRSSPISTPNVNEIIQGGGFTFVNGGYGVVTTNAPIVLQTAFSNVRGTLAMARTAALNSATSQWFLNTVDNIILNTNGGGYAVFGRVNTAAGLAVMDAIRNLPTYPRPEFQQIPLRNYTNGNTVTAANVIYAPIERTTRPFSGFSASSNAPGIVTTAVASDVLTLNFAGGTGTARVTVDATDADGATGGANGFDVTVSTNPPQANLANISTRAAVGSGENVLIGGFVIRGSAKRVLIRALGPSLIPFGVTNAISDPQITLQQGQTVIASNDNWKSTQQADIQATGFAPSNDSEAALIATLQPGSYTPIVSGVGGATGVSIVEVYELSTNESPQLINISTRGRVGTGTEVMIGGFVIGGTTPKKVLVRVAGPSLTQFGVTGALADPTLELNSGGRVIASNNDYQVLPDGSPNPDGPAIAASGFQPADVHESAIIATLAPGSYTAIVRGVNDTQGVAIVEVYDLD
ncbi:MAG: peptidylprolyl isomerase [Verrucomicrobia bacterium]|nr:peptidylprolyl isomerase [Verrucomicrobiota bacterium]